MRKRWYLPWLVAALVGLVLARGELRETHLPPSVRSTAGLARFLDAQLPPWLERYRVPGACVGLFAQGTNSLRCYGTTLTGSGRAVDGRSRFGVASVSKTFTALAVLTLAARSVIVLDDPVERHLRTWRFPRGPYDGSSVTVHQLLTHTAGAGISSYGGAVSPAAGETTQDVLQGRSAGRIPVALLAPPGSGFRYSGGGYMVLQQLVEDVSGEPFERFVATNVFAPLGMRDSSFSWGSVRDGDAAGHDVGGQPLALHAYGAAMAPGAMVTTGEDMLAFVSAFAASRTGALLGWPAGEWQRYIAPGPQQAGMGLMFAEADDLVLAGHAGTTMGYTAGFNVSTAERYGWFLLVNGNGGMFLKPDVDRLFTEWRTGVPDHRRRFLKQFRAAVVFAAFTVPAFGVLLLASFAAAFRGAGRRWAPAASGLGPLRKAFRITGVMLLTAAFALWLVFFHTEWFYPAYTTAWMPYAFRYVTLGVGFLALRAGLSLAFVKGRRARRALAPAPVR